MKRYFLFGFLFAATFSFGQAVSSVPVGKNNNGVPTETLVTICATNPGNGTCNSLVTTYTDITLGTSCTGSGGPLNGSNCSNPGHTDVFGNVVAFAASGFYWCQFSGSTTSPYSVPCPSSGAGSGGSTAFSSITAGTNTAALVEGTGGSLTPSGTGQIISTSNWLNSSSPVVTPSPAGADSCPTGLNPTNFVQDASGNWEPSAGIDPTTVWIGYSTLGWLAFCRPVEFISGARLPNYTANGALTVFKTPNSIVSVTDTFGMQVQNNLLSTESGTFTGQILGAYGEVDINGTPQLNGNSTAGQVGASGFRGVINSNRSAGAPALQNAYGVSGGFFQNSTVGTFGVNGAFYGICAYGASVTSGGGTCIDYDAQGNVAAGVTNGIYVAFQAEIPFTSFPTAQYGFRVPTAFPSTPANESWNFYSTGSVGSGTGKNMFNGPTYVGELLASGGAIPMLGSWQASGSFNTAQLANPTAPLGTIGHGGTAGSTSYTYNYAFIDGNGKTTKVEGAPQTTTTGNATLSATDYNILSVSTAAQPFGTVGANFYRTASSGTPSSTGLIGTVLQTSNGIGTYGALTFNDTGLAGDGNTNGPQQNTTGSVDAPLYATATNCSNGASPAVCGSAAAGAVAVPTGATPTLVIDTTAVTALSEIELTVDESLTISGVTCNTTLATLVNPVVTARSPGTSFTITMNSTLAANPACVSYSITN